MPTVRHVHVFLCLSLSVQETDEKKVAGSTTTTDEKKDGDDKDKAVSGEKKDDSSTGVIKKEKEADFEILHNPTRVVKAQVCDVDCQGSSCYLFIMNVFFY